jgi:SAM-dependent methyltransferase
MGVNFVSLLMLAGLSRTKILRGDVLTFGRHNTFFSSRELRKATEAFDLGLSEGTRSKIVGERFTEGLFAALGAASCQSVDASDYEGASIVHDLNLPFAPSMAEKFDFIYDGGTTEHVYDVAEVQRNVARALKVGGYYFATCPTNGEPGHGFYQFSPEFYFRSLQKVGFRIIRLYLVASQPPAQWYRVQDPHHVGGRVTFLSAEPVYVFVVAQKIANDMVQGVPLQSDYEEGNWVEKKDHLVWDRSLKAKLTRAVDRIVMLRAVWALNVLARNVFLAGTAIWPTSAGIQRVNIVEEILQIQNSSEARPLVA